MATTTVPQAQAAPAIVGVDLAAVSTIPFDGVPMTQAITEGYGANAKSPAQLAAMTKAKITDFKAVMKYEVAVRIGVVNTGTPEAPVFEDRYEMKPVYVWADIVSGSLEFYNAVMTGNAYNPVTAPSTTVPATTTTPV
jgi:hypothetical protein